MPSTWNSVTPPPIHRAQGATLDTAHALLNERTTREALYVAASRGRISNRIYVDTSARDSAHDVDVLDRDADRSADPRAALAAVISRSAATASAHAALADAETAAANK